MEECLEELMKKSLHTEISGRISAGITEQNREGTSGEIPEDMPLKEPMEEFLKERMTL